MGPLLEDPLEFPRAVGKFPRMQGQGLELPVAQGSGLPNLGLGF